MRIVKPIVIVGTGRCGSTVFHHLLATHPQVMWLSSFCNRFPRRPGVNRWAVAARNNPFIRRFLGRRIQPGECYRFWDTYAYGFSQPCRDLVSADVTGRTKKQVRAALEPMLTTTRSRLLLKITGWSRIGFLNEIFEDAKFIHIMRDGRGVANSLLHVNFWRGWQGPQGCRGGSLSPEDQAAWESYDRSFVALAALEWKIQMQAIETARQVLEPARFLEVKYETLCDKPMEIYRRVLEFADLPWSAEFERQVKGASIRNSDRWRDDLTEEQQAILEDLLREDLLRYGYDAVPESQAQLLSAPGRMAGFTDRRAT